MKTTSIYIRFLLSLYYNLPGLFKRTIESKIAELEGGYMYSKTVREIYEKDYKIMIGYGSYGGCFSKINVPPGVSFGNYCSIASNIRIFRANHPKNQFTTHPLLYNPVAGYVESDQLDRPALIIGNDVWIGEWAVILPSVKKIGDGAIIGAGAVVTKDIEPYSIVAGNPATKKGQRFDQLTINKLAASRWWELEKDELIKNIAVIQKLINE